MKIKKSNFIDWNYKILITSLKKIDLNILLIVILDALFYFLSGYLFIFWLQRIQAKMAAFNLPQDVASIGYERLQQIVNEAKLFYYLLIFSFILLLIAIIFLSSVLKGIIWTKTTNTKITFALISRFLGLNLIWMGFWFVLVISISLLVEPSLTPAFMIATIILGLYFTNALYAIFMKKPMLRTIIASVKLSVAKIHLFLLPYSIILLLFFILVRISAFLKFGYASFLVGLILLFYAAIVRYYISTLVLEIGKV